MKHLKKYFAAVVAFVLSLAMVTPAFAQTITVTPPSGVDADATNTYTIYKVFDATVNADDPTKISYKLCEGDTLSNDMIAAGFAVDSAGNVTFDGSMSATGDPTDAAIAAVAAYVTSDDIVGTATSTGTANAVSENLAAGYYYITTTTGTFVTIDTNNTNVTVIDKNTIPTVDKTITGASSYDEDGKKALAQVGTTVNFSVTLTPGSGAKGYVFHDVMDSGLSYNNDVQVNGVAAASSDLVDNTDLADGDTITIAFKDGLTSAVTITYSATVTANALSDDPLNNTATLDYGEGYTTTETSVEVYNAQFTVTKQDGDEEPLAGAGFVIANAAGKYYKLDNGVVTWVDSIDNATEYTSDDNGAVTAFTGLANGTYTLIEKTVPDGYNKAADSTFTIAEHDYTGDNLEQAATVTNNAGTELPSTGGIGTTIFYVVGGLMVLSAGVMLITKRRMANIEK